MQGLLKLFFDCPAAAVVSVLGGGCGIQLVINSARQLSVLDGDCRKVSQRGEEKRPYQKLALVTIL